MAEPEPAAVAAPPLDPSEPHHGGCVCGLLRYAARGKPRRVTVCHCTWCQRRTGSAFGATAVFPLDCLDLRGPYRVYRHLSDESGRWLDLHFCPSCGGNIGFTLEWVPDIFAIDAGTFDQPGWLKPGDHTFRYIFMSSAQAWSEPPPGAECHARHFRV